MSSAGVPSCSPRLDTSDAAADTTRLHSDDFVADCRRSGPCTASHACGQADTLFKLGFFSLTMPEETVYSGATS